MLALAVAVGGVGGAICAEEEEVVDVRVRGFVS
jgi:hypothetical protein